MKYLKTPLRYPGGKSRVAKDFIPRFPNDIGQFREPFLGGGSVALLFTQEIVNALVAFALRLDPLLLAQVGVLCWPVVHLVAPRVVM